MRDLLVDALAVARLTRLVTEDTLPPLETARAAAYRAVKARHGEDWAEGILCPWCVSVHLAVGVVVIRQLLPRAWSPAARALAFSYAAGWLNTR